MVKSIWEFDIFDFFSYIVPGVIAILLLYPITPKRILSEVMAINGTVLLLILVLGGYIGGHIAHRLSDWLEDWKRIFVFSYEHEFDKIANSDKKDPVQTKFFEKAPECLGIPLPDDCDPERTKRLTALYHTAKAYLMTHDNVGSGRVEKFSTLHELFHSLISIFSVYGIVYLVWSVIPTVTPVIVDLSIISIEYRLHRSGVGYAVVGVGLLWLARTSYHISVTYRKNQAKTLITEFYTGVLLGDEKTESERDAENSDG